MRRLFAAALALLLSAAAALAADWTRVQGSTTTVGTGTSNSIAFGAPVTNGNLVRGSVLLNHGSNITNVTDDKGNPYRVTVSGDDGLTAYVALFRSLGDGTGLLKNAPQTITVTVAPSSATFFLQVDEFAPPTNMSAISLDGGQAAVNNTPGTATANFRTTKPDTLVYSASVASGGTTTTGAGFNAGNGSGTTLISEWKIQATASDSVAAAYATMTGTAAWIVVDALAPVTQTTWEPIQRQIQRTGSGTSAQVSLPNPVTNGNIVTGSIAISGVLSSVLTSLQDDKGRNYSLVPGTLGNVAGDRQIFWSGSQINNAPQTLTATFNTSQTIAFFLIEEFAPPPNTVSVALDGSGVNVTNASTSETTTTTPNITTTGSNRLLYSFGDTGGGNDTSANSFSALNGQSMTWEDAWRIEPNAGTINAQWSHTASATGGNNASLVAFAATAAPAVAIGAGALSVGATLGLRGAGGIGAR